MRVHVCNTVSVVNGIRFGRKILLQISLYNEQKNGDIQNIVKGCSNRKGLP